MDTLEIIDELYEKAMQDEKLRAELLASKKAASPLASFCETARKYGFMLYPIDVVTAGEEAHAAMKRSTNGGGENSPMLDAQDDYYVMFMASLLH